jgi:hypothetical protein
MEEFALWIFAALDHSRPGAMFWRSRFAVRPFAD